VAARRFLILHGWEGSGPDHWQTWLAARLRATGEHVQFPVMPEPDEPRVEAWQAALGSELAELSGGQGNGDNRAERVVICHSLACLLWMRHAVAPVGPRVDRVLLVAPPSPWFDGLPGWGEPPMDAAAIARAAGVTRLVCSPDDPYCPEGADVSYAEALRVPVDCILGAGHFNEEAGFGAWPAVEAWAYGAKNGVEM
jgi:predicted alpha/beta hydrolase family esterase